MNQNRIRFQSVLVLLQTGAAWCVLFMKISGRQEEGVQSSSNSNHRHSNLFCGKCAPQLVISTTSNSNHPKKA